MLTGPGWRGGAWWRRAPALGWWLLGLLALATAAEAAHRVELEPGVVAVRSSSGELFLEALPARGEGLRAFVRRFCGGDEAAAAIAELNGSSQLLAGVRYRIPFSMLGPDHQRRVVAALFPGDRVEGSGWRHRVERGEVADEGSLWRVAEWFTGRGETFVQLREANGLADDHLQPGQELVVPAELLRSSLRALLPPAPPAGSGALEFGDPQHAVYRLRPGEALYSSVVVRFTGRVFAEDVNALASEIAAASGIADVTDIPVGYRVKIPYDLLLPEYLPAGDPRRQEYEAELSDSSRFSNRVESRHLDGITIVLDAGHGGADVGASMAGVWESLYVYDIMVRVRDLLESRTAATVVPTIRDGEEFTYVDRDVLPFSRGHRILTNPPYAISDSRVGVNLRWYLANSVYRRAVRGGGDGKRVVFVSIHADSLHPSLRGAMVYIPAANLTGGRSGRSGVVYASRQEVREQPQVEFPWRDRVESEGLSRDLANHTLAAFRAAGLAVHDFKPVREKIIRKRSEFVPAVLRYNAVPAKMLVEVCNLANEEDRRLIQTRAFRQRVAEAIVDGLLAYYGEEPEPAAPAVQVAATAAR